MDICHVAAEYAPLIKVGGLADVTFGLSRQLLDFGHKVEVILPYYATLNHSIIKDLHIQYANFYYHRLWQGTVEGVLITLIEPLNHDYFKRKHVYGEKDDVIRFATFSLIAHYYLKEKSLPPLVHLHDWHTALVAFLNQNHYATIYTIHNLAYMGQSDASLWKELKIPIENVVSLQVEDHYNLMKAGILYADHVTAVSPTYAQEIVYTTMGGILQNLLYEQKEKITGILNGIDKDFWNPENDPFLPYHFTVDNRENKKRLKDYVKKRFHLDAKNNFMACSIARLVPQKGPELIIEAIKEVLAQGGIFIVIGSSADPEIEKQLLDIKTTSQNKKSLHIEFIYDEELSHIIFGASDLFVMPSLYEPCGLTQLIALRYGTLPLVRETGGLKDTIFHGKNGFTFKEMDPQELKDTLRLAFTVWQNPTKWQEMVQKGMKEDHSWEKSAREYLILYEKLLSLSRN